MNKDLKKYVPEKKESGGEEVKEGRIECIYPRENDNH